MKHPATRLRLTVAALCLAAMALPVTGQEPAPGASDAPKSLLPDEPAAPPPVSADPLLAIPAAPTVTGALTLPQAAAEAPETPVDPFALPEATGRDISTFGVLAGTITGPGGGYGPQTFTGSNGRFVHALMRRIDAPVGSRWAHIMLRRALLTESAAPAGINPGDWIAGRIALLTRIGEIDGAKAMLDAVPVDRFSPGLYRAAALTSYAAADLGGLCPLATTGALLSKDPLWRLSVAMCAAMQGDDVSAAAAFDTLRDDDNVDEFDVRLGERVATLAGGAGRATNIDWAEAPRLTIYRWGVATAAGVQIPDDKLAQLGAARFGWVVRTAPVRADARVAALRPAAVIGIMSGDELVSGIAASVAGAGDEGLAGTPAGRLRQAFAGTTSADRLAGLRAIWASGADGDAAYAALIESAPAALRIAPSNASAADAGNIVAALLAVGAGPAAARWWPAANGAAGPQKARVWGLLAAGAEGGVPVDSDAFADWRANAGAVTPHRAALLIAALTGLGRAGGSDWDDLRDELLPDTANNWTRAIDRAAAAGRTGEVIVLAATALQGQWSDVPPPHLRHLIAALVRVGRGHEARMIAAEAVTRG